MKFEKVHNYSKIKILIFTFLLGAVISGTVTFMTTKATYRTTQSINVANGVINYDGGGDLSIIAVKVQNDTSSTEESNYTAQDTIPIGKYLLNTEKSICQYKNNGGMVNIEANMTYDNAVGRVTIDLTRKGTKCYTYFDILSSVSVEDIISNSNNGTGPKEGSTSVTSACDSVEKDCTGLYYIKDGANMYGSSNNTYYYRGLVDNNWVYFAGIYWRIIRINGDGSIRIIYSSDTPPTSGSAVVKNSSGISLGVGGKYSSGTYSYAVGFYYNTSNGHGTTKNGTPNNIAKFLIGWFDSYFGASSKFEFLSNAIDHYGLFCADRSIAYYPSSVTTPNPGYDKEKTLFGPAGRVTDSSDNKLSEQSIAVDCEFEEDVFSRPIGLITSDEVLMAGGYYGSQNSSYWLKTNNANFTMSPFKYDYSAYVAGIGASGDLTYITVGNGSSVRPVINLRPGTLFTAGTTGEWNNVYTVVGADTPPN